MKIGIQVSVNLKKGTGVEEYVGRLLEKLFEIDDCKNHQFFMFDSNNFKWPLKFGRTQIRLGLEMLKKKLDILFVPAHTFPLIHPKKIITVIHGLEFERSKKSYSFWQRKKLRFLTKRNAKKSEKIIVPSECTKKDLIKFYKINPKKIFIIPPGIRQGVGRSTLKNKNGSYILYLGSNHKRKNIINLKCAYKILKQKYKIKHNLILAGINQAEEDSDIIKLGYITESQKWQLLDNADVFVFPSLYEGFGMPPLEAQSRGVPVVASSRGSFLETLGDSALLINPEDPKEIAEAIYKIISNPEIKKNLIKKGYQNIKKFNWTTNAKKTLKIICESP